jgi:uncharacterized protein YjbI with pentapeptide repeats
MTKAKITRKEIDDLVENYYRNKYDKLGKSIDLSQYDLRGMDLRGIDLKIFEVGEDKLDLNQVIIDREQLDLLKVLRTSFGGVRFKNENLGRTKISDRKVGLSLEVALDLSGLDFTDAHFDNVNIAGLIWCDTKLDNTNLGREDIDKTITSPDNITRYEIREINSRLAGMLSDNF